MLLNTSRTVCCESLQIILVKGGIYMRRNVSKGQGTANSGKFVKRVPIDIIVYIFGCDGG